MSDNVSNQPLTTAAPAPTTAIAPIAPNNALPATRDETNLSLMLDADAFERVVAVGKLMAGGKMTVPRHLQGNVADCTAIAMQAAIWNMNPFAVAQKTHEVGGRLGYEAQLVIAVVNNSPALRERLAWEWFGPWERIVGRFRKVESKTKTNDDGSPKAYMVPDWSEKDEAGLGVRVRGRLKGEEHFRELELLLVQARVRNSTLWAEDPKQQLAYLASKRWARLHLPDVVLGVYTPDELDEGASPPPPRNMGNAEVVAPRLTEAELASWEAAAKQGTAKAKEFWSAAGKPFRAKAVQAERDRMWAIAEAADKARTVEAGAGETKAASGETKVAAAETQAAASQTTGEPGSTDDFVAAMERAERDGA